MDIRITTRKTQPVPRIHRVLIPGANVLSHLRDKPADRGLVQARPVAPKASMTKFTDEVVRSHNVYRQTHQAPPLTHSPALSDIAQKWADSLARSNSFQHSQSTHNGERLGENISMKWSSQADTYTGKDVTDQWYSEASMYQFGRDSGSSNTGHFSQVVWKGSTQIGVGRAQTADGKVIVVANYKPAGNFLGRYAQNVLPSRDGRITLSNPTNDRDANRNFSPSTQFSNLSNRNNMTSLRTDSSQSRSVRTYTVTEGSGPNAVTKTVVEETVTLPDGRKTITKKETVTNGGSTRVMGDGFGNSDTNFTSRFGQMGFGNDSRLNNHAISGSNGGDSTKPPTPQTMSQFRDECLSAHNNYRAKHGVPSLKQSRDLNEHAQKWAEKLAALGRLEHSSERTMGENVAYKWSSGGTDYTGGQVTDQWYSEISKVDFGRVGMSPATGHFSQVVWKGSREFGVGKARSRDGKVFVVANYRPAGNMRGDYQDNVFPPRY